MKSVLTILFLACSMTTSFGAIDSIYVESNRNFDQIELEAYRSNPDFSYIHESQTIHWWDGIYEWLVNFLSDWFEDKDSVAIGGLLYIVTKIALWTLMILAIGLLAYSLYKNGVFGVIGRKRQALDLSFSELEDQVLETDWQQLIGKAVANQQFNVAIRLHFLQLLQSLNSVNQIEWNKSKSIRDYQRELSAQYNQGFVALARYYQYSWFGDVQIDESHFNQMQDEFNSFNSSLNVE
ncbi:MAG: hypothetical protein ABJH72_18285 [Reichenbachiella sp.]|uniref:hypothetical protein n=2 Tax=Reichenbachiella sp. TaxID=2184521 RepID=UPI0032651BCD